MDSHFQNLGIARGAAETDMKRAFKKKALQFHPDRNPNGAEMFKKINASYEQLCVHYKKNGGVDKRSIFDDDASGGSTTTGFRQQARSAGPSASSAPLFTEEELFGARSTAGGSEYGMFGSSARTGGAKAGGYTKGFRQRDRSGSDAGAKTYSSFDPRHDASEEKRTAAHGNRTAQSGYSAFTSAEDMSAFESQMRHFEEMERKKRDLHGGVPSSSSTSAPPSSSTPPRYGRRSDSAMGGGDSPPIARRSTVEEEFIGSASGPLPPTRPALYTNKPSATQARSRSTTHTANNKDEEDPKARSQNVVSQRQMEEEWEFERQVQDANKRAEEAQEETMRRVRKEQREREVQEEWDRTQAEMEQDKLSKAAASRTEELRKQLERRDNQRRPSVTTSEIDEDDIYSYRNGGGMAASAVVDAEMVATAKARRATKEEKIQHMLPSLGAVDRMSLPELHILQEALNKMSADVLSLYHGRLSRSTHCLVCHVTKMDPRTEGLYSCDHAALCYTCSFTCAICPLCGAERKAGVGE